MKIHLWYTHLFRLEHLAVTNRVIYMGDAESTPEREKWNFQDLGVPEIQKSPMSNNALRNATFEPIDLHLIPDSLR